MTDPAQSLAIALFSEILTADQLVRNRLSRVLPKGMELSHFSVLNHLVYVGDERTPAQLARTFHVTRGAMTNTLNKTVSQVTTTGSYIQYGLAPPYTTATDCEILP